MSRLRFNWKFVTIALACGLTVVGFVLLTIVLSPSLAYRTGMAGGRAQWVMLCVGLCVGGLCATGLVKVSPRVPIVRTCLRCLMAGFIGVLCGVVPGSGESVFLGGLIGWLVCFVVLTAGISDKPLDPNLCTECGYDAVGLAVCPECGWTCGEARQPFGSKRHEVALIVGGLLGLPIVMAMLGIVIAVLWGGF